MGDNEEELRNSTEKANTRNDGDDHRESKRSSLESNGLSNRQTRPYSDLSLSGSNTSSDPDLEQMRTLSQYASRVGTLRIQHSYTVGETNRTRSRASATPLPAFGGGKPYPPQLPAKEEYVVEFDGPDDPLHPQNWPMGRKYVPLVEIIVATTLLTQTES